jgi:hypothetical protein
LVANPIHTDPVLWTNRWNLVSRKRNKIIPSPRRGV